MLVLGKKQGKCRDESQWDLRKGIYTTHVIYKLYL